jgi:hypothetical protein
MGLNDGKGFVFISHQGGVFPSGFLPLEAGNLGQQSLTKIYRHSPLFIAFGRTENLKGNSGVCEFREVCRGSRARPCGRDRRPVRRRTRLRLGARDRWRDLAAAGLRLWHVICQLGKVQPQGTCPLRHCVTGICASLILLRDLPKPETGRQNN